MVLHIDLNGLTPPQITTYNKCKLEIFTRKVTEYQKNEMLDLAYSFEAESSERDDLIPTILAQHYRIPRDNITRSSIRHVIELSSEQEQ